MINNVCITDVLHGYLYHFKIYHSPQVTPLLIEKHNVIRLILHPQQYKIVLGLYRLHNFSFRNLA